jgi:hypothetical protein
LTAWWHVNWKGIGLAFVSLVLALVFLGGVALAVAYQLGPWQSARMMLSIDPDLNAVPSVLPDTSIAPLNGTRVEYFGFSFLLPWKSTEQVRDLRDDVVLSSSDGAIMIKSPSSDASTARMIHHLAKSIPNLSP